MEGHAFDQPPPTKQVHTLFLCPSACERQTDDSWDRIMEQLTPCREWGLGGRAFNFGAGGVNTAL